MNLTDDQQSDFAQVSAAAGQIPETGQEYVLVPREHYEKDARGRRTESHAGPGGIDPVLDVYEHFRKRP